MGLFESKPRKYGDPLPHKEFTQAAEKLMTEKEAAYIALTKCVNETEVNMPVTLRCRKELGDWNAGVLQSFCNRLYWKAVQCQKAAGDNWPQQCKEETNELMTCGDEANRRLFQFNLERNSKRKET